MFAHLAAGNEPGLEGAQAHDAGRVAHRAAVGLIPHQRHLTGQAESFQCTKSCTLSFSGSSGLFGHSLCIVALVHGAVPDMFMCCGQATSPAPGYKLLGHVDPRGITSPCTP